MTVKLSIYFRTDIFAGTFHLTILHTSFVGHFLDFGRCGDTQENMDSFSVDGKVDCGILCMYIRSFFFFLVEKERWGGGSERGVERVVERKREIEKERKRG